MLDAKKTLQLGGFLVARKYIADVPWLSEPMLNYKNKQDWRAVQEIFSQKTCDFLQRKIAAGEDHRRGTWVYCVMGCKLLNAWFAEADEATNGWTPSQSVQNAACVLAFLVTWRSSVDKNKQLTLKHDCMTRETILDSYTLSATCVLRFPFYREEHPEHKPYGPNFCQSRFSEYGFNRGRMRKSENSTSLSVRGWWVAFNHTLFGVGMEANSNLRVPDSRRGVPHTIGRVVHDPPSAAYRRATQDPQLQQDFLAGVELNTTIWRDGLGFDISKELPEFFDNPWKHFDLPADLRNICLADDATRGKEDTDDEDEEVVLNSQDADDAAELMGRLIAHHAPQLFPSDSVAPDQEDLAVQHFAGPVFREFNGSLTAEGASRKHRFRTGKLVDGSADQQRTVITEDASIIAVFEHTDGTLYWIPGHVDEIRVTAADIDEKRISDADLQRLEKAHVKEVSTDDARAVFLIRWYVEVDQNGVDLDPTVNGYNSRKCSGYRLTTDNNGYPFRWLSNFQVLMPVEMVGHTHPQCRMFRLHHSERKPVVEQFEALCSASTGNRKAPKRATAQLADTTKQKALAAIATAARSERAATRAAARVDAHKR